MGAKATIDAISKINFNLDNIYCIIGAFWAIQQLLLCNTSLIAKKLKLSGIASFDVNSTCLNFICAMEVASSLIQTEKYINILIVCSDISSVGLNYDDVKSCILLGNSTRFKLFKSYYKHLNTIVVLKIGNLISSLI